MPLPPELKPLDPADFSVDCARHLLNRAGFGGTPEQVQALVTLGLKKSVDALVDYESRTYRDTVAELSLIHI